MEECPCELQEFRLNQVAFLLYISRSKNVCAKGNLSARNLDSAREGKGFETINVKHEYLHCFCESRAPSMCVGKGAM